MFYKTVNLIKAISAKLKPIKYHLLIILNRKLAVNSSVSVHNFQN